MTAKGVVAAGHWQTAAAAEEILRAGGNAFDAALAGMCAACAAEPMLCSLRMSRPSDPQPVSRLPKAIAIAKRFIGRRFDGRVGDHPLTVIPLPHPSGRSTWFTRPSNRELLDRALTLIGEHASWRATFPESTSLARR